MLKIDSSPVWNGRNKLDSHDPFIQSQEGSREYCDADHRVASSHWSSLSPSGHMLRTRCIILETLSGALSSLSTCSDNTGDSPTSGALALEASLNAMASLVAVFKDRSILVGSLSRRMWDKSFAGCGIQMLLVSIRLAFTPDRQMAQDYGCPNYLKAALLYVVHHSCYSQLTRVA